MMACPFHATDLPGRESLKNMKPESPFLNLGQSAHCKKLLQGFPGILAVLYVNNSFFPFFIQSASGTMLRFLQTVDRNILAGLGALCPILLIVNLIGQGFQLCKVMFRFVRILLQIILQCDFYDFVTYIASNGRDVWPETYFREDAPSIFPVISDFFDWLRAVDLMQVYQEKWAAL